MSKTKYQAVLFATDGEHVSDFKDRKTKQDVWSMLEDMGSRWFFYPLCFVATDKRIVDAPEGFESLIGKSIKTAGKSIKRNKQELDEALTNNWPVFHINF